MDAAFTSFERRGWDIHALSSGPDRVGAKITMAKRYDL